MRSQIDSITISGDTLEEALVAFKQRLEYILLSQETENAVFEELEQEYNFESEYKKSNLKNNSTQKQEVINALVRAFTVNIDDKMSLYRNVIKGKGIDEMYQIPGGIEVSYTGIKKNGFLKVNIDKYIRENTPIGPEALTSYELFPNLSLQTLKNDYYGAASFIEIIPVNNTLDRHTKAFYYVKDGDGLEKIINRFYPDFDYQTGNDRRTVAKAIHVLNETSNHQHGIYFRNPSTDFLEELEEFLKSAADPFLKEQRIFYSSILLSKNKMLRLPTIDYIKALKAENIIESRPEFMDLAIAGARSYQGFVEGFWSGVYNEIKDMVVGLWDLIKGIFTGKLFKSIWDLIKTIIKGEGYEKILKPMLDGIGESWDNFWKKFNSGNPRLRWFLIGEIIGKIVLNIVLAFFTMGATVALVATTKGAALMAKFGRIARIVETAIDNIPKPARKKIKDVLGDKAGDVLTDSDNRNLTKKILEQAKKEAKKEALKKAGRLNKKNKENPEQFSEFVDEPDNIAGKEPPLESVNQRKERLEKKTKIKGDVDYEKERVQAINYGNRKGGGTIEFGDSEMGIEGYFIPENSTDKIPFSLKRLVTETPINVFREIRQNAKKIRKASNKEGTGIKLGTEVNTEINIIVENINKKDLLEFIESSKPNIFPQEGTFKEIVIETVDGLLKFDKNNKLIE